VVPVIAAIFHLKGADRADADDDCSEGVLNLAARSLDDRDFLTWLMDMFNPEEMCINVGGGKKLEVTEFAIKCVLGLPSEGSDPPLASEDSAKEAYKEVAAGLFPDEPEPRSAQIHPTKVAEAIVKYRNDGDQELDDDFCIRLFFMVLDSNLLTPNTSCYIRNVDAHWCRNLESIAHYNWCTEATPPPRLDASLCCNPRSRMAPIVSCLRAPRKLRSTKPASHVLIHMQGVNRIITGLSHATCCNRADPAIFNDPPMPGALTEPGNWTNDPC
jgi:hypothetical protein